MKFFEYSSNGYILGIGKGNGSGAEISESRYNTIIAAIRAKPPATETIDYHLKTDLTWEEFPINPEPILEITDAEVLAILLGEGD